MGHLLLLGPLSALLAERLKLQLLQLALLGAMPLLRPMFSFSFCFIANKMHGISHIMPTELPTKMYMWNIAEKRKELLDLLERGVSGSFISAFGLEKSSFLDLRKSCFW